MLIFTQSVGGGNFTGSWALPIVSLRARKVVASRLIQWVSILPSQGVSIPESGVPSNQGTITLSANAVCGSVDNSTFPLIMPVGSFRSTVLAFVPHQATLKGSAVGIEIRFASVYPIGTGEIGFLLLPGFRGVNVASLNISTASGYTGSFALDDAQPSLKLTAAGAVPALQISIVHIRANNGIMLPFSHNQSSLLIGSSTALGPSVGQPILKTPAVGVFTRSSVHFGSPLAADSRANATTSIRLQFMYSKDIRVAETVTLQLPLFAGVSKPLLALTSSTSVTASWDALTYALQLTWNSTLSAGTLAHFQILGSNGIVLPIRGVEANQSQITLSTNANHGSSSAVPVLLTEQVGAFMYSSLDFVGAAASMPAQIILSYTLNCGLEVGDILQVSLPNVYGTDEAILMCPHSISTALGVLASAPSL